MNRTRLLAAAVLALQMGGGRPAAQSAIAFVQQNYSAPQSSTASVTIPYTAAQTAGNLNVVVVGWNDSTALVQSVTDRVGNTYALAVGPTIQTGLATQAIYYAKNILGAPSNANAVTVMFDRAASYPDIRVAEYRGLDPVNAFDVGIAAIGSSGTSSSGAVTTTSANDLIIGANLVQTATSAAGSGFTKRVITNPDGDILEDRVVTATGSYSATASVAPAGAWLMQMVAFRAAGSGGTGDTQPPSAPANLAAAAASSSQIGLTWNASTDNVGVTGYRLERCQGAGCTTFVQIATPAGTSYSDTGLTASTSYAYRVVATDAANNVSGYSNLASATTQADTQAPSAPTSLTAAAASGTQINLTWTASTDNVGVSGYRVERCQAAGCTTFAQIGTPTATSYSDSGLTASTSYSYRVRATDAAGNLSAYSATATTTTQSGPATSFVQANSVDPQSATTVVAVAFSAAQTAGNLNVVAIGWNDSTTTVQSVTDTRGNAYGLAVGPTVQAGTATQVFYYATNIIAAAANANTVTVTFSAPPRYPDLRIAEYAGIDSQNPIDVVAAAQGNSATGDTGAVTTRNANDLLVAANLVQTMTTSAGANFTKRLITSPDGDILEDRVVTSTGSYNATAPVTPAGGWIMQMVAFRSAGSLPPPPPADLIVAATHAGSFAQGQSGASYTLTASNTGAGPTVGAATVTDTLPASLTAVSLAGAGWTCAIPTLTCTRSDVLAASAAYPPITLTVNVAANAPSSVTNTATVGGGGEANLANNSASDVTAIAPSAPDTVPPSAPGALTATAVSGTQINLSWLPATDNVGVAGYRVERCQGEGCSIFVKLDAPTGTTYTDSAVSPNMKYSYQVVAMDIAGNLGPYSNVSTVTTLGTIPSLIASYSFDEGTGTTAVDASGKGHTGTIANAIWTSAAKYGTALTFNGSNSIVTIPNAADLQLTGGMTLEAWVNPTAVSIAWRDVIYKAVDNYYLEATSTPDGYPTAGATIGSAGEAPGLAMLPLNTWTHLAETYDGSTLRLYVNGTQVASASRPGAMQTSTNPLQIGGDSTFGQYFQGTIDEVRVYNVALSPTQILADMGTPISGGSTLPAVALSPVALDFGSQPVGATSAAQVAVLANVGTGSLAIGSISVGGLNPSDFVATSTCGSALAAGTSCTITVTFTPIALATRSATLTITDNAAGTPHAVPLSGVGTGFSISPTAPVLTPGQTQQFTASGPTGAWSVDSIVGGSAAVGTITAGGLYVSPNASGIHTVAVTSQDQTQTASAVVTVSTYPGTFTHHNDNSRSGQNLAETTLTPANVNSTKFGKLLTYALDGQAIASPLYVSGLNMPGNGIHNVVYVATEHDSVYAFDADGLSTTPLWRTSFTNPGAGVTSVPNGDTGECCDIAPEIGITGTPVIDASTGTLYVVAKTKETAGGAHYVHRLHALDITTGSEKFGGPVLIQATVPGTGGGSVAGQLSLDQLHENQRPGLLLLNGVVYIGFSSHGDYQPYHGWILGYNATTLAQVMAFCTTPNGEGGGVWQSGGGLAADAAGNIYFVTGDGAFDVNTGGRNYGDSFIKLSPTGAVLDYFTPHDQALADVNNQDVGAGGLILLPTQPGAHPRMLLSAGKNANMYLIDRDSLGHYDSANDNQIVESWVNVFPFGTPEHGNFSAPVYFDGMVYLSPIADTIQAFRFNNGLLTTGAVMRSSEVFAYPGGSIAISANGSTNGILWAIERNGTTAPGVLRAYDANNLAVQLYASDQAGARDALDPAAKASVPLVAKGKVFVASTGRLTVYGLLP